MGFAEARKALPVKARAVWYAPILQWHWKRGDRADLSDLVFGGSGVCIRHVRGTRGSCTSKPSRISRRLIGITRARRK